MLKPFILTLYLLLIITSCDNNNKEHSHNTVITSNNESQYSTKNIDSLTFYKSELEKIKLNFSSTTKLNNQLINKNKILSNRISHLESKLHTTNNIKNKKAAKSENTINKQEKRIHSLINKFLESWDNLPSSKNTKTVTKFFTSKYRCNRISIDHDNTAQISWHNETNFDQYIKSIISKNNWTFKTTDIIFLDTEIKDSLYFNSTFKYSFKTYDKNTLVDKSNFIVTITGKKINNEYKIVNYSWVRFSFM